jgi:hypothetical protein
MLNLQVNIDTNSGFCFGVIYAIEMAEEILNEKGKLYCLGDIVHNDEEVKRLQKKGLQIIDHEQLRDLHNEQVLIRAHGEPPSTYELAMQNNLELIDASCPVVLKLQNRIKSSFDKKEKIYIYGKQIKRPSFSKILTSLNLTLYHLKLPFIAKLPRVLTNSMRSKTYLKRGVLRLIQMIPFVVRYQTETKN